MRLALGQLGWSPDAFWRATPRELAAAIEGRFGRTGGAADRSALDRLMAAYPD
ncbi:MAG: phage tail assembly chaperone [Phreatobacter sp.]|uniref:phage tail assembly chaperone n=1 Tax=Phreatobacter sp. TaxID=1966341 RepID=UPI00273530E0|nr:phage tail assembly chaperone [Phreatobacter sp.]MDP2802100.1 phage tail assembly chaperone [Phreatobacter sp.]